MLYTDLWWHLDGNFCCLTLSPVLCPLWACLLTCYISFDSWKLFRSYTDTIVYIQLHFLFTASVISVVCDLWGQTHWFTILNVLCHCASDLTSWVTVFSSLKCGRPKEVYKVWGIVPDPQVGSHEMLIHLYTSLLIFMASFQAVFRKPL